VPGRFWNDESSTNDEGSTMPMAVIFIVFLMVVTFALVSASQQWNARRDALAVAAAAARAGAQGTTGSVRNVEGLDVGGANDRAQAILGAAGFGGSVSVSGESVTVTVVAPVKYAFPSPGFPATVTGTSTALARQSVDGG
jgi:Flp pilus assembly protein TadG